MKRVCLAILATLVASCSDLPPIEPDTCGNRVLEPDEDCDTFSIHGDRTACGAPDTANGCFYVCDAATSVVCPLGWGCGRDGRCRFSTEQFTPFRSWPFVSNFLHTADIDGDGNPDLVGYTTTSVTVRFGSIGGVFDESLRVAVRRVTGLIGIGHLDSDAGADIVAPNGTGINVLRGLSDRNLAPVAYSPIELPGGDSVRLVPLESDSANSGTERLILADRSMAFEGGDTSLPFPLNKTVDDIIGRVPIADLFRNGRTQFALPVDGASVIWVYTSTGSVRARTLRVVLQQRIALPSEVSRRGAMFADVNGDGHDDLLVSVGARLAERLTVAYWAPQLGAFSEACVLDLMISSPQRMLLMRWPLAVGDFDGDGRLDFVHELGVALGPPIGDASPICGQVSQPLRIAYASSRGAWSEAVSGDFNGDGRLDVAGIQALQPEMNVLLGSGAGAFNAFDVQLDKEAATPRVGDFDGDYIQDIAFVLKGEGVEEDELGVVFGGAAGGPSEPISMGQLATIEQMEPLSVVPGREANDLATDLLVTSKSFPDGEVTTAAIMFGSTERRLLAPYVLVERGLAEDVTDFPVAAVVGEFCRDCASGESCQDARDVAAVAFGSDGAGGLEPHVWLVPGDPTGGPGALSTSTTLRADFPTQQLDATCAAWLSGDLDGDGWDELLGLDETLLCPRQMSTASRLAVVRASRPQSKCNAPLDVSFEPLAMTLVRISDARLKDADGDGDPDLLLAFSGDTQRLGGRLQVIGAGAAVVWNEGGRLSADSVTTLTLPHPVFGVDVINIDADGTPEIVIASSQPGGNVRRSEGLYTSRLGADNRSYGTPVQLIHQQRVERVAVADLDGDGLDDIAWSEGDVVRVIFAIPRNGGER